MQRNFIPSAELQGGSPKRFSEDESVLVCLESSVAAVGRLTPILGIIWGAQIRDFCGLLSPLKESVPSIPNGIFLSLFV